MADDLISKCTSLCLDEDDKDLVDLGIVESMEDAGRLELQIIGRLVTNRSYNEEAFRRTMEKVWMPANNMVIRSIGPNLFMFQFFHWRDKEKVLRGRPWCWENNLLLLKDVEGEEQPEHVALNHSPFWIRVCNLPFNCRSTEDVRALTANLGNLLEVEEDSLGLGSYRRVRVEIDIRKPLRRHQWIKDKKGNKVKIDFKYERLPFFCFACGTIGHAEKDCAVAPEEERKSDLGRGTFLRASPRRGYTKEQREAVVLSASRKLLFITKKNEEARTEKEENQSKSENQQEGGRELICVGGDFGKEGEHRKETVAGEGYGTKNNMGQEDLHNGSKVVLRAEKQRTVLRIRKRVGRDLGEGDMEVDESHKNPAPLLKKRMEREEGDTEKDIGTREGKRHKAAYQVEAAPTGWTEVGDDQPRQAL